MGPCIVSASVVPDAQKLKYRTYVNRRKRHETGTERYDLECWAGCGAFVAGTTLRRGTVVMTGTPSGVGLFMKPQGFFERGGCGRGPCGVGWGVWLMR